MQGSEFDEAGFFRTIAASGARALLLGRRALVALGIPVLTANYDSWLHIDDIAAFNAVIEPMGLLPTRTPDEARGRGRYVLENDERVDVLVARTVLTVDGVRVAFDDVWPRRRALEVAASHAGRPSRLRPPGLPPLGERAAVAQAKFRRYPRDCRRACLRVSSEPSQARSSTSTQTGPA